MTLDDMEILAARLQPGDTVVLKTERNLTQEDAARLKDLLETVFNKKRLGFSVETLILEGGTDLEIVRPGNGV